MSSIKLLVFLSSLLNNHLKSLVNMVFLPHNERKHFLSGHQSCRINQKASALIDKKQCEYKLFLFLLINVEKLCHKERANHEFDRYYNCNLNYFFQLYTPSHIFSTLSSWEKSSSSFDLMVKQWC